MIFNSIFASKLTLVWIPQSPSHTTVVVSLSPQTCSSLAVKYNMSAETVYSAGSCDLCLVLLQVLLLLQAARRIAFALKSIGELILEFSFFSCIHVSMSIRRRRYCP